MITLVGVAYLFLGALLILYTLGALLFVLPKNVTYVGKLFTGITGFSLGSGMIVIGSELIAGVLHSSVLVELTTVLAIGFILKFIPIIALAVLLYLLVTDKYHKKGK